MGKKGLGKGAINRNLARVRIPIVWEGVSAMVTCQFKGVPKGNRLVRCPGSPGQVYFVHGAGHSRGVGRIPDILT